MDGIVRLSAHLVLMTCLAAVPLLPRPAAAALPRYVDAAGFVRGTARGMEPIPGSATRQSAEAVAQACLDALAGSQGRDAFVQASVSAHGTFQLTAEQRERFEACIQRAGYRFHVLPPVPPGAKRIQ